MSREVDREPAMRLVSPPRGAPLPRAGSSSIVTPRSAYRPPAMSLPLDIGQGAGISGATGVRPFLPALAVGALAKADAGIDFDGTDYSFLESPAFLFVVLLLAVAAYALSQRGPRTADGGGRAVQVGILVISVVLGALFFA